jgi:Tfp pilus assembly protein FimT
MIVVVIIVVLIAIAGTTWLLSLNHLSLRNDTRDIASALRKAKQAAVTTGRPHQVYFDIANEVFEIEDCNAACDQAPIAPNFGGSGNTHGIIVGSLKDLRITTFGHKPINLANILDVGGLASNQIVFEPDGTAEFYNSGILSTSTTVTITLARTDGSAEIKTIVISNAGGIRVP